MNGTDLEKNKIKGETNSKYGENEYGTHRLVYEGKNAYWKIATWAKKNLFFTLGISKYFYLHHELLPYVSFLKNI